MNIFRVQRHFFQGTLEMDATFSPCLKNIAKV